MDCVKYSINQISKKGLSLDGIVLLGVLFGGRVISYFFIGNILVSISALLSMFLMLKMILFTDTKPYHEVGLALALGGVLEIVSIIASPVRMFILDITVTYIVYAVMYFALAYIAFKAYYDNQVTLGNAGKTEANNEGKSETSDSITQIKEDVCSQNGASTVEEDKEQKASDQDKEAEKPVDIEE